MALDIAPGLRRRFRLRSACASHDRGAAGSPAPRRRAAAAKPARAADLRFRTWSARWVRRHGHMNLDKAGLTEACLTAPTFSSNAASRRRGDGG